MSEKVSTTSREQKVARALLYGGLIFAAFGVVYSLFTFPEESFHWRYVILGLALLLSGSLILGRRQNKIDDQERRMVHSQGSADQVRDKYAGFWPRYWANFVDGLILTPIIFVHVWFTSRSYFVSLAFQVLFSLFFAFYNIYFIGRWGQTLGKMALGIKVVSINDSNAGFRRAFLRHLVDLCFSMLSLAATFYTYSKIDSEFFNELDLIVRTQMVADLTPFWAQVSSILSIVWILSELVVLLSNSKRRAIHDFIAGTAVVHQYT